MFTLSDPIVLAPATRRELEAMTRSTKVRAGLARRAQLLLALADGISYAAITRRWGMSPGTISRWKSRFQASGIGGLLDAPRDGRPDRLSVSKEAKILKLTKQPPPAPLYALVGSADGEASRRQPLHGATGMEERAGLKPHRLESYMESPDPAFEENAADIIGLYLDLQATPPSSASTRRPASRLSIDAIRGCLSLRAGPSGTDSSTSDTGRSLSMRPWR